MASIVANMNPVSMMAVLMILAMVQLVVGLVAEGVRPEPANSDSRRAAEDKQTPAPFAVVVPARWSAPAPGQAERQIRRRAIPPVLPGSRPVARLVLATA